MNDPQLNRLFDRLDRVRREYADLVDELLDFPASARAEAKPEDWSQPLDEWWQANRTDTHREVAGYFEKLVEHGRILFRLAAQLEQSRGRAGARDNAELVTLFKELQQSLSDGVGGSNRQQTDLFSPMSHLMASWRHHASGLFGIADDPLAAISRLPGSVDPAQLREHLAAALNPGSMTTPLLAQSQVTELLEALVEYQRNFNRFARLAVQAAATAISRMKETAAEEIESESRGVRHLYSDWLEYCEHTYDELVRDDEFADALCALLNSAVRIRAVRQRLADKAAVAMGLPSHSDVRELARALHETRRRLRRVEKQKMSREEVGEQPPVTTRETDPPRNPRQAPSGNTSNTVISGPEATEESTVSRQTTPRRSTVKKKTTRKKATARKKTPVKKTAVKKTAGKKTSTGKSTAGDH